MKLQILFTMNNYVFVSICLVQIVKINGYLLSFYFLFLRRKVTYYHVWDLKKS